MKKNVEIICSVVGVAGLLLLPLAGVETSLGKPTSLYMGALVYLFLCAVWIIVRQKEAWKIYPTDVWAAALLVYVTLNYLLISEVVATTKFMYIVWMGFLYLNLRIILSKNRSITRILLCSLALCGLLESILGIMQALGFTSSSHNLFKITGTFFNPGPYGGYLAVVFAVTANFIWSHRDAFARVVKKTTWEIIQIQFVWIYVFCLITTMAILIVLPATLNRAAFIAMCSCMVIMCLRDPLIGQVRQLAQISRRRLLISGGAAILLTILIGGGLYLLKKDSANGRLLMWKVTSSIALDHPITGVGFGAFPGVYAPYQAEYFRRHPDSKLITVADCPEYAFNEYLLCGAELGLLGLLLLLAMTGTAVWNLMKHRNIFAYGLLALLIFSLFSYPLTLNTFQILLVAFVSLGATAHNRTPRKFIVWHRGYLIGILFLYAIGMAISMHVMQKKQKAETKAEMISNIYHIAAYDDIISDYHTLYSQLNDRPKFLFEYGHSLNKVGRYHESNRILGQGITLSSDPMFYNIMGNNYKELQQYDLAEDHYIQSANIIPNRLYPYYLLMKLYMESAQIHKAQVIADKIIHFEPKVSSSATRSMQREAQGVLDQLQSP